jgi:hypothetical protein
LCRSSEEMGCHSSLAGSTLPSPAGQKARKWLGDPHRWPSFLVGPALAYENPEWTGCRVQMEAIQVGSPARSVGIWESCYRNCAETAAKSTRDGDRARGEPYPMRVGLDIRLWEGVARLLDRSISVEDLQSHRREVFARMLRFRLGSVAGSVRGTPDVAICLPVVGSPSRRGADPGPPAARGESATPLGGRRRMLCRRVPGGAGCSGSSRLMSNNDKLLSTLRGSAALRPMGH